MALLLGGNLGDVSSTFARVRQRLGQEFQVIRESSLYRTEAWGMEGAPDFLNQVVVIRTGRTAQEVLDFVNGLEAEQGRQRNPEAGYQSRIIDIDILSSGQQVIDRPELQVPHPRLHLRNFTLAPMLEVMPDWQHPVLKKSLRELWEGSTDTNEVQKL